MEHCQMEEAKKQKNKRVQVAVAIRMSGEGSEMSLARFLVGL